MSMLEGELDKNQIEIFGELTYSQSLTYEELLESEKVLLEKLDTIFLDAGASHLDFTPLGDLLMLQCAFEYRSLEILRDIAAEIASVLPPGISGRMLCLERNLRWCHMFWMRPLEWQESDYELPAKAPEGTPINKITRIKLKTHEVKAAKVAPPAVIPDVPMIQIGKAVAARFARGENFANNPDKS